jgi:hypothetical protein
VSDEALTEFIELDPNAVHLVPAGASGFPFLLAKSIHDTVAEVQNESRSHQPKPKGMKMKKRELRAALAEAEGALAKAGQPATRGRPTGTVSAETALTLLKSAAEDAERMGDVAKADGLRREIAVFKLQVAERRREQRPSPSRLGPGSVQLFDRTGRLGEDVQVQGL